MAENKLIKWKEQRTFLGKPPFGYRWNKEKKELEIIPEEEKIYKKIISLYLDEGLSLKELESIYHVSENALKVRLFRARQRVLKAYAKSNEAQSRASRTAEE